MSKIRKPKKISKKTTINNKNKIKKHTNYSKKQSKNGSTIDKATAPYNFVPLNDIVVPAEDNKNEDFDEYIDDRNSGYINLKITTVTPLFIKGANGFFNAGGKLRIPGSSIRGMIRTLIEIASFGKFHFYNDKTLYYRTFDGSSLSNYYLNKMIIKENNVHKLKVKSGLLEKNGEEYYIYPSKIIKGTQFYRVRGTFQNNLFIVQGENGEIKINLYNFKEILFKPEQPKEYSHRNGSIKVKYGLVQSISEKEDNSKRREGFVEGYLVASGHVANKKMQWIINKETSKKIRVPKEVIKSYKEDDTRKEDVDILKKTKEGKIKVPCFYLSEKNQDGEEKILAIGHTGMFRLPYKHSIKDHIHENLRDSEIVDIAEVIFGKEGQWATRVFVEDAIADEDTRILLLEERTLKILSSPKPTCFQHYLEQPLEAKANKKKLVHWDDIPTSEEIKKAGLIRGYKLYWHRNTPKEGRDSWSEPKAPQDSTQHIKATPVKSGVTFKGQIRFENLTDVELGALLFVLDLPDNCYHKIGMGKPLGLGSISIETELHLIDRINRYKMLFETNDSVYKWYSGNKELTNQDDIKNHYKEIFEQYVLQKLNKDKTLQSLWETERLKELRKMLDWNNTNRSNWLIKTKYRDLREFKDRKVLPKPSEIVED